MPIPLIGGIAAAILVIVLFLLSYVKAPPDHAFLISGVKKQPRVLIGRAGFRIPFLERMDRLYLGQMSVDIKTDRPVPTNDFINVSVDAVAKIRIMPTPEGIALAAKNFLNKSADQISMDLMDSLQGNMREIVGTLSLKDINTDRDSFSDEVMNKASKDLAKLGIEIVSCNIQNVTDENGLIKDLGADNTAKIKKDASIAKAQADRDVAIAQAQADREANDARVQAETEIAQKNTELEVKKAELKVAADMKRAQADAAYKIEEQEQQRSIETATVNAQIAKTEREAELKQRSPSRPWTLTSAPRQTQRSTVRRRKLRLSCSSVRGMPRPRCSSSRRKLRPSRPRQKPPSTPRSRRPLVLPLSVRPRLRLSRPRLWLKPKVSTRRLRP